MYVYRTCIGSQCKIDIVCKYVDEKIIIKIIIVSQGRRTNERNSDKRFAKILNA